MAHCIYRGVIGYNFKNNVFLSLKINFVLANSVDPDEMTYYAAFHLGLHCLPSTCLGVSSQGFIFTILRRCPRAFQIGKISAVDP